MNVLIPKRNKRISSIADEVAEGATCGSDHFKLRESHVEFINTGSTTLNLAFSGTRNGGWPRARVSNPVGDGSTGKTILALQAAFHFLKDIKKTKSKIFPKVKNAIVVYNNGEGVMDFPLTRMFGEKFEQSITWRRSPTVEALGKDYLQTARSLKEGDALLYIADSWDQYKSVHDNKILETVDEDISKNLQLKKQQFAWKFFSECCELIDQNKVDSTLIIISQTKKKIGVMFGSPIYRTGGDALNFYTHLVPWLRVVKELDKTKKGEKRIYAIHGEAKVKRSKVALPYRSGIFKVLLDYGVDDIGGMALYLKQHKISKWHGISLKDDHLFAKEIEAKGLQEKLSMKCERVWNEVEKSFLDEVEERERRSL